MNVYELAIRNVQSVIRSEENTKARSPITLFDAVPIIAIAFGKRQEDVTNDLLFRYFED